jgi:predicted acylesterase/phospholipase RssA
MTIDQAVQEPPLQQLKHYCDLVLKGGITSGVVYPEAICKLAVHYKLKNIGGTSAGAIAAALAAAAEYQRRNVVQKAGRDVPESMAGFDVLRKIARELPEQPAGKPESAPSKLLGLFQPSPATRPLFRLLLAGLNQPDKKNIAFAMAMAALAQYHVRAFAAFLLVFLFTGLGSLLACWPLALTVLSGATAALIRRSNRRWIKTVALIVVGIVAVLLLREPVMWFCVGPLAGALLLSSTAAAACAAYQVYAVATRELTADAQGFGLCTGMRPAASDPEFKDYTPLTEWLHERIQEAAGRRPSDPPLTFGDLWQAPGFPPPGVNLGNLTRKSVNLQMVTTNLSHCRPYLLPFEDQNTRLFFRRDEMLRYFPESIVDALCYTQCEKTAGKDQGTVRRYRKDSESDPPADAGNADLIALPPAKDLPVVFATRLSLSFPVLLSAIPLWAINYEAPRQERRLERCWFSDGGISSNFPIHFFDGLLPLWPTFGFTLENDLPAFEKNVFMPVKNTDGRADHWDHFQRESGLPRLTGFLGAIFNAAQNWSDSALTRMPGVRDRVVRIYLKDGQGGLNLNMTKSVIAELIKAGSQAADEIIERYINRGRPDPSVPYAMDWENHTWVRLNSVLDAFAPMMPGLAIGTHPSGTYRQHLGKSWPSGQFPLASGDDQKLAAFLDALNALANAGEVVNEARPVPRGTIRSRPPL